MRIKNLNLQNMKTKSIWLWVLLVITAVSSCKYDDGELWDKVNSLDNRVTNIEEQLTQMNTNISSISTIVNAIDDNLFITSLEETANGYSIKFSNGETATLTNGTDGAAGKDAPVIGFDEFEGKYYWTQTIDGQQSWLTDDAGNKLPVTGIDAVTPQLKVNTEGFWMVSYDNGLTYAEVLDEAGNPVKAVGEDGKDGEDGEDGIDGSDGAKGDSWFSDVRVENGYVVFVLIDGTEINIPFESEDTPNPIEEEYFDIEEATYHSGAMPEATTELPTEQGELIADETFAPGGSSYFSLNTTEELEKIYIGVEGKEGYYEMNAADVLTTVPSRTTYMFNYQFILLISQQFTANVTLRIVIQTIDGRFYFLTWEVRLIEVGIGELQISLAFSNAKDVDLHVIEPNGNIIFFGSRQPWLFTTDSTPNISEGQIIGLDLDSNPVCNIDNVNKENIYFPAEYVQKGTYTVLVDMYSNCDENTATDWTVRVNYRGQLIRPDTGTNPANGTFPIGTPSNGAYRPNMPIAMTFTINEGIEVPVISRSSNDIYPVGKDLDSFAKMKLLQMGIVVD